MPKIVDITGQRFGRLVALERIPTKEHSYWRCRCDCGKETIVYLGSLRSRRTRSCGCLNDETHWKHGHSWRGGHSRTYKSWDAMISRTKRGYHPTVYHGVMVCDRWLIFENFLADMGERPLGKTLDRWPDKDGDYEPGNCRWATPIEQARNSHKVKPVVRSDGKYYATIIDAANDVGINFAGIVKVCRGQRQYAGGYGWKYANVDVGE